MAWLVEPDFLGVMTPATEGLSAAMRAFVVRDYKGALTRLREAERGMALIRQWIEEDLVEAANG